MSDISRKEALTLRRTSGISTSVSTDDTDADEFVLTPQELNLETAKPLSLQVRVTELELTVTALASALIEADTLLSQLSPGHGASLRTRILRAISLRLYRMAFPPPTDLEYPHGT